MVSRPCSASRRISAAVNVFVTLAIAKGVCGVTRVFVATTASPATPVQVRPSARITVAATPGMTIDFRAASSARWRTLAVAASTGGAGGGATIATGDVSGAGDGPPDVLEAADGSTAPPAACDVPAPLPAGAVTVGPGMPARPGVAEAAGTPPLPGDGSPPGIIASSPATPGPARRSPSPAPAT